MSYPVTLIPGDGIGPELADATVRVLDATGIGFEWETQSAGEATIASEGTPLPDRVIDSIRRNGVAIKGPITTPVGSGFRSVNVGLRQALELYANVRPARTMKGVETRYDGVDLISVRENTEDLYAGIEHRVGPDAAESIKIITRAASQRIARYAFEYAVLVLPNLYGDIVSALAAGLVGGLGVAPGANIGEKAAVFEPVHGSAPKYAGQNKANPTALILSGALMLRHLGETDAADAVERATRDVIAEGTTVTYDLGGSAGTREYAEAVASRLRR